MSDLTNAEISRLKGRAQLLDPILKVGRNGLSEPFLQSVRQALQEHELIKIKFIDFKEEKKVLSKTLAEKTESHLIMRVGNVAVLYRRREE